VTLTPSHLAADKADHPTVEAYAGAAWLLRCEVRAVMAVAIVEAGAEGAFLPTGEPVILFERHHFDRLTYGRFTGATVPGTTTEPWRVIAARTTGGYGPYSAQHRRLQAAVALDRDAALKSASWGLFQIMGSNHAACGFPELQRFVTAMYRSADDHLRAFVQFIRHDGRLVDAIRARDWSGFARVYNGPKFAKHGYDRKLAAAYDKLPTAA
jgi:hypothetical protein